MTYLVNVDSLQPTHPIYGKTFVAIVLNAYGRDLETSMYKRHEQLQNKHSHVHGGQETKVNYFR